MSRAVLPIKTSQQRTCQGPHCHRVLERCGLTIDSSYVHCETSRGGGIGENPMRSLNGSRTHWRPFRRGGLAGLSLTAALAGGSVVLGGGGTVFTGYVCNDRSDADRCPARNDPCPPSLNKGDWCEFCTSPARHRRCVRGEGVCDYRPHFTCGMKFLGSCTGYKRLCRGSQDPAGPGYQGVCHREMCFTPKEGEG